MSEGKKAAPSQSEVVTTLVAIIAAQAEAIRMIGHVVSCNVVGGAQADAAIKEAASMRNYAIGTLGALGLVAATTDGLGNVSLTAPFHASYETWKRRGSRVEELGPK